MSEENKNIRCIGLAILCIGLAYLALEYNSPMCGFGAIISFFSF